MSIHPFDELMTIPESAIRLDCAALHLARDAYPHLSVFRYLARLDALADEVAALRPGLDSPARYQALRAVLHEGHGLRGNEDDYYDPDNSYLNRVLERGLGIPISLGIIWIEVGRRLKWPVSGVALPGHFLVRVDDAERFIVVDVFRGAVSVDKDDCRELLRRQFQDAVEFEDSMLEPVRVPTILARVLNNLRNIYIANGDVPRLTRVLERLCAAEPDNSQHAEELAALLARQGELRRACSHLSTFLSERPDMKDGEALKERLMHLISALHAMN